MTNRIYGIVYTDTNNNGNRDTGETGVAGVTIALAGINDLGQAINLTTTTGASGSYSFLNLRPGTYTVTETQPATLLDGKDNGINATPNRNDSFTASLTPGSSEAIVNFGELKPSTITGTVYHDANNDGAKGNTGETGIFGVTIALTGINDLGQTINLTTTTTTNGTYSFTGLRPGNYTITEIQPVLWLDGKDTGTNATPNGNDSFTVSLMSGSTATANFGELKSATVSGFVYHDINNDGIKGTGETGISSTPITLTGINDLGQTVNFTTTAAMNGSYSFTGLRPGSYTVTETQPASWLDGKDTGANATSNGNDSFTVNLTSGSAAIANFGELKAATVSGFVFNDANNDSIKETGDVGVSGTAITLIGTNDLGQAVSLTTTTGIDGKYSFTGLRPGSYTVTEAQPIGLIDGDDTGTNAAPNGNDSFTVSLTPGSTATANFGELAPASVSGTVYNDANNNGTPNAGETGSTGITINLTGTNDLGQAVNLTATTNATGNYSFTGLRPGNYTVTETQPANLFDGQDSGTNVIPNGNDSFIVNLTPGLAATANFGERSGAVIGDRIWRDDNANGIQDAGEVGISSMTVTLVGAGNDNILDTTDDTITTTTTDSQGNYLFSELAAGTYQVYITPGTGYLAVPVNVGNDATDSDFTKMVIVDDTINLVTNGSFENFENFSVIGWTAYRDYIEVLPAATYGVSGAAGTYVAELDSGNIGEAGFYQNIPTVFGETYRLSFDVAQRGYTPPSTNTVEVWWGGNRIGTIDPSSTTFSTYDFDVTGTGRAERLEFREQTGDNDTLGGIIDNVRLFATDTKLISNPITLALGAVDLSIDAGLQPVLKGTIGNQVWWDDNHNGIRDVTATPHEELGFANVQVNLYSSSGVLVATTLTSTDGYYQFSDVDSGYYYLEFNANYTQLQHNGGYGTFTTPGWWSWATKDTGSDDTIDSDVQTTIAAFATTTDVFFLDNGEVDLSHDAALTPLVIDLNGDGIHTIARANSTGIFDLLGTGTAIASGWVSGDDAFLARDANGNGKIDDIGELFGGFAKGDGFGKLAAFDSNHDSVVDTHDARFTELTLWRDTNGNHHTDDGELIQLTDANVTSLSLSYQNRFTLDTNGNVLGEHSTVTLGDGTQTGMTDVYFNVAASDAAAAGVALPELHELIDASIGLVGLQTGAL